MYCAKQTVPVVVVDRFNSTKVDSFDLSIKYENIKVASSKSGVDCLALCRDAQGGVRQGSWNYRNW